MGKIANTARGLVIKDDMLLLMERFSRGEHYFSIPGGKIEPGESSEETVVREILEETGVRVRVSKLVAELRVEGSTHYIFLCDYESGEPSLQEGSEEAQNLSADNTFEPSWKSISGLNRLYMRFWDPLKPSILNGLKKGFPIKPIIVEI